MGAITLSSGVRQNLLSLQNTANLMATTQNRLATGKKVNTALDNPTNFFTSSSLQSRAGDLNSLLDSMSNGIKTLEAADNGLSSITKTVESMQSTLRQARQDKSFKTASYEIDLGTATGSQNLEFTGGSVGTVADTVDLTTAQSVVSGGAYSDIDFTNAGANNGSVSFSIAVNGGSATAISVTHAEVVAAGVADAANVTADELASILNDEFDTANVAATVTVSGGNLVITGDADTASEADVTISGFAAANGATGSGLANGSGTDGTFTAKTVDALVSEINASTSSLNGKVRASNDNGKLRLENLSTSDLTVTGVATNGTDVDGGAGTATIGGNEVRTKLVSQFNELRDQLDKLADDASFNGVNLLRGDKLKLTFNETGTSTIDIQTENGAAVNSAFLSITDVENSDFDSDTTIDAELATLGDALNTLRSQASTFGSNLSIVENRQDFTKNMIATLQTGADNLVLADTNEEAANMLALQTRQQLSSTALSLASQADQAALRLF